MTDVPRMIRFELVTSKFGMVIVEHRVFVEGAYTTPHGYRAMTREEAIEGMASLGMELRMSSVGGFKSEYFHATEEQAVLVKMFMQ